MIKSTFLRSSILPYSNYHIVSYLPSYGCIYLIRSTLPYPIYPILFVYPFLAYLAIAEPCPYSNPTDLPMIVSTSIWLHLACPIHPILSNLPSYDIIYLIQYVHVATLPFSVLLVLPPLNSTHHFLPSNLAWISRFSWRSSQNSETPARPKSNSSKFI